MKNEFFDSSAKILKILCYKQVFFFIILHELLLLVSKNLKNRCHVNSSVQNTG